MNKTVSIHLQGIPFIFEEQAFDRLNTYLQQLKQVLQKEEGSDEILQDIELRMVELLQQQLTPFKQVVAFASAFLRCSTVSFEKSLSAPLIIIANWSLNSLLAITLVEEEVVNAVALDFWSNVP